MTGDGGTPGGLEGQLDADSGRRSRVLLGTDRRWLVSALEDVLTPEGFRLIHARDPRGLVVKAEETPPALVIVDEELDGIDVEATARELVNGPIGHRTPLLLYTSSAAARVQTHTRALEAGFWDLLSDPLRPSTMVARFRRMLAISDRIGGTELQRAGADIATVSPVDFLSLEELGRVLPVVGALAEREGASVTIVMLGLTSAETADGDRDRASTASLFAPNVRRADLCAWSNDAEVAIVAYDTRAREALNLVERLNEIATRRSDLDVAASDLSAGIVELEPSGELRRALREAGGRAGDEEITLSQIVGLFHLEDAREALREVREAGGGVRVVEID